MKVGNHNLIQCFKFIKKKIASESIFPKYNISPCQLHLYRHCISAMNSQDKNLLMKPECEEVSNFPKMKPAC